MSQHVRSQLELINDYSWVDIDVLKSIPKEIDNLLDKYEVYISPSRKEEINKFITRRINTILYHLDVDDKLEDLATLNSLSVLEEEIINYIKKKGKLTDLNPLIKKTGNAYITIYRAVSELTKNSLLKRVGSRKTGYWILPIKSN